ncbi:kinase-like protein [Thozetella sp. PMI_491]|nr:kinase-like protein [Thozetella sp. PMI_491]
MQSFKSTQSMMLAPYLCLPQNEIYYYKLSKDYNLPFITYEQKVNSQYGRVMKIKIHRAHHNFKSSEEFPDENPFFALKVLHSHEPGEFKKEVEVLQKFSGANNPHPHLIRLLLAFRHADIHYLLFNWADGDLKFFWSTHPNPQVSRNNTRWVVGQCLGLAKALQKIHRATSDTWPKKADAEPKDPKLLGEADAEPKDYGRHGDIKPENIVWFRKLQRLVITDFGLSRYHSRQSKSHDPNESLRGYSPTYRPPEYDLQVDITPRYDVWALGCVLLEFISWYILGNELTENAFSIERVKDDVRWGHMIQEDKFFNIVRDPSDGHGHAVVKPAVKKWIRRIHASKNCPDFAHEFLDLIEKHLLVTDSKERFECANLVQELTKIEDQCTASSSYCVKGNPIKSGYDEIEETSTDVHAPSSSQKGSQYVSPKSVRMLDHFDPSFPRPKPTTEEVPTSPLNFSSQEEDCPQEDFSTEPSPESPDRPRTEDAGSAAEGPTSGMDNAEIDRLASLGCDFEHDSSVSVLGDEENNEDNDDEIGNEDQGDKSWSKTGHVDQTCAPSREEPGNDGLREGVGDETTAIQGISPLQGEPAKQDGAPADPIECETGAESPDQDSPSPTGEIGSPLEGTMSVPWTENGEGGGSGEALHVERHEGAGQQETATAAEVTAFSEVHVEVGEVSAQSVNADAEQNGQDGEDKGATPAYINGAAPGPDSTTAQSKPGDQQQPRPQRKGVRQFLKPLFCGLSCF